ncbi:MAG: hypothetical protein V2I33_19080, partial [Kangiellaceae bacterium]|nr:hypothetical protein [Kangiellaceae bacterium]
MEYLSIEEIEQHAYGFVNSGFKVFIISNSFSAKKLTNNGHEIIEVSSVLFGDWDLIFLLAEGHWTLYMHFPTVRGRLVVAPPFVHIQKKRNTSTIIHFNSLHPSGNDRGFRAVFEGDISDLSTTVLTNARP